MTKEVTTRRSKRLEGTSSKTRSEDATYEPIAEEETVESKDTDDETSRRKRRKVAHTENQKTVVKNGKRAQRKGKVDNMRDVPLDVLIEIFSLLEPADLVTLSKVSHGLLDMMLDPSSSTIWKAARRNAVPAMPVCPLDMNELAFAELLFGNRCHFCQKKVGTIHTVWAARKRICNKCIDDQCVYSLENFLNDDMWELKTHVPGVLANKKGRRRHYYYFAKYIEEWRKEFDESESKEKWKASKVKELEDVRKHVSSCEAWLRECGELADAEEQKQIDRRYKEIKDYIDHLGWGPEVARMGEYSTKYHQTYDVKKLCQKPLTQRILNDLTPRINEFMSEVKKKRLASERYQYLSERLPILKKVHNAIIQEIPIRDSFWYPMASEMIREPSILAIVDDSSLTLAEVAKKLELEIPVLLPDVATRLRNRIDDQLFAHIVKENPAWNEADRDTVFNLASTVFQCGSCNRYSGNGKRHLLYQDAVIHSCTRSFAIPETISDHKAIAQYLDEGYRSHRSSVVISKVALTVVPYLVKLCGLDPDTTTAKMMDELNPIFECLLCGVSDKGRATMTWLAAVPHFESSGHPKEVRDGTLILLDKADADKVRERLKENQERARASRAYDNNLVQCAHCKFAPPSGSERLDGILAHVKTVHKIEKPTVETDIIPHMDANHVPPTFFLWPPRR
ncbi:hypothetical protein BDN70DRAFT_871944 [Pholiota conissans]|uniref:F-box domain-containing protein n=1 Tax=Pholiota conissans TaxID=109636 RepID=A0A9P5ZEF9_9AGAR|nr:hypothetical protein BDN70DRAFT_871944 [Pholiota conissans]